LGTYGDTKGSDGAMAKHGNSLFARADEGSAAAPGVAFPAEHWFWNHDRLLWREIQREQGGGLPFPVSRGRTRGSNARVTEDGTDRFPVS